MTGLSTQESRIDQSPETGSVTLHLSNLVEGVMERTRRGAIAWLMVLANGISSPAQAQTAPRVVGAGQEHTQILGATTELPKPVTVSNGGKNTDIKGPYTVTASVSTSASAAVDKKDGGQILRKADGSIDFGEWLKGKTPEERKNMVKGLTDSEYDSYLEWKTNENEQKVATISALDTISVLQKKLKSGQPLTEEEKKRLQTAINTPGIKPDIRQNMFAFTL